jgi:anti-sigma regulatory factor (Ser/Thr protein kinase)
MRTRDLRPEPCSPRLARELVRAVCRDWGVVGDACEDAVLVVTELVANVVDHARTACVVTISRDGPDLRIDVEDYDPCGVPTLRALDPRALRGRGLAMIAAVSASWGVTVRRGAKSVWAVLAWPAPQPS